ncbi:MAG: hypothetical protein EZS26_002409 [Candidatus Ordinivivax streblomastigis]|uniref:asparagine synthase (glutamine-hydrolyzing) n=1 Tax=Candidatus Ordinivivax streblomastigis TaxID=2540710 RepID=A0A5M8NZ46_9BACT|nr:MAG: hypothetical protein EZS26_002409 [Candidatus Ordinivivax streblomastigis]
MTHIRLVYNSGYQWVKKEDVYVKGFIFTPDNQLLRAEQLADYFSNISSFHVFQERLQQANGLFSVVVKKGNILWAAVDTTRSFPLFYYHKQDSFFITDNPDTLKEYQIPLVVDEDNAILFAYSGFVNGAKTLLKEVYQIIAGQSLCYENDCVTKEFHKEFLTETFSMKTREELKAELKQVLDHVGKRMVKVLNNRPVAIPLSGGFDSRLIAYLLRKNNYPNVICYTFGKNNNPEQNNAQRTTHNLGYPFYFINYENYFNQSFTQDPIFKEYVNFATNYCNRFAEQDYFAIRELMKNDTLPENTVFIPGDSGAIAGHLLDEKMEKSEFSFAEQAFNEVFSLVYPRQKEVEIIRKEIHFLDKQSDNYPPYLIYENWRFQGTTALAFNSSKIWAFWGFEHLLPLWDRDLFDFFVHVPFQHKYDKNLYKETLIDLFNEFNIYFPGEELYPSTDLIKKVSFRSKLKSKFPFLKKFVHIWKNDHIGNQYFAKGFLQELKASKERRTLLSFNGISSAWYLMQVRKTVQNEKNN